MSVVLIGGHDRMHVEYKDIGDKYGYKLKIFTQLETRFEKKIGSPDAIILFTNTVSHKMIRTALKKAKKSKIPVIRCHTSSGFSLEETLKTLDKVVS